MGEMNKRLGGIGNGQDIRLLHAAAIGDEAELAGRGADLVLFGEGQQVIVSIFFDPAGGLVDIWYEIGMLFYDLGVYAFHLLGDDFFIGAVARAYFILHRIVSDLQS